METITSSDTETKNLGREVADKLIGGEVIALQGNLGSGKTTFVQGLAEGLGIKGTVLSPTFIIRRSYHGRLNLEHFDFYRLEKVSQAVNLDLAEILGKKDTVTVVEWPEKINFSWPHMLKVKFDYQGEKRLITYENFS